MMHQPLTLTDERTYISKVDRTPQDKIDSKFFALVGKIKMDDSQAVLFGNALLNED